MKHLVLGGARSGKSGYAQQLAEATGLRVVFIATAESGDTEMAERIARHREFRPGNWELVEEPIRLSKALVESAETGVCVLIDCLTLWMSNLLARSDAARGGEVEEFLAAVKALPGCAIFVSNEVGLGIVPENRLAREFRDCVGRLHQDLAGICSGVTLVVAGRPLQLRTNCSSGDPVLRFEFSEVGGNFVRQVNFPVHRAANASSILPIDLQNRLTAEGIDLQAILGSHVDGAAGLVLDLESQRGNLRIQLIR